jgi:hypothetical protein
MGRPRKGEKREPTTMVAFPATEEVMQAIEDCQAITRRRGPTMGSRSELIRRAILELRDRLVDEEAQIKGGR